MSAVYTYCDECDHVHPASRKSQEVYWLCMKFPRLEGMGFVSRTKWVEHEPFMRCKGINGGLCPLWKPRSRNEEPENGKGNQNVSTKE